MTNEESASGWYYAEGATPKGPLSEAEFQRAVQAGAIGSATMVWRPGWADWKPYGEVGESSAAPAAATDATVCDECGAQVPASDLTVIGDRTVCARCKPALVQRLMERGEAASALHFGGFWLRFAASIIDSVVVSIAYYAVYIPVMLGLGAPLRPQPGDNASVARFFGLTLAMAVFSIVLQAGYEIWMVGRFRATVGKMACRLQVVQPDGGRVSYARAAGRHFAKYISSFTLGIGYLLAGFDREKRALHDMICDTRVIRV